MKDDDYQWTAMPYDGYTCLPEIGDDRGCNNGEDITEYPREEDSPEEDPPEEEPPVVEPVYYCYRKFLGNCLYDYLWTSDAPDGYDIFSDSEYYCSQEPYCFRKDNGNNNYSYLWTSSPGDGYTCYPSLSESECRLDEPQYCTTFLPSKGNVDVSSNTCSKILSSNNDSTTGCSESGVSGFYSITCKESHEVTYSPNLEKSSITLKVGAGFTYSMDVSYTRKCDGSFNYSTWNDAHARAVKLIERATKVGDGREIWWYTAILNDINGFVTTYNSYEENSEISVSGTINLAYKEQNKKGFVHYTEIFEVEEMEHSESKIIDSSNCQTLNGERTCNFTYNINSAYLLQLPQVYLDKISGEVIKTPTDYSVDGGRKLYISMKAAPGNGTISTSLQIDTSKATHTTNNSNCSLVIEPLGNDVYRIVEDSNAFVNNSRQVGINWLSSNYDFTKIIDKNTSTKSYVYSFNLSKSDITSIKQDNKNNTVNSVNNVYLGTCIFSKIKHSGAMQNVCNIINAG